MKATTNILIFSQSIFSEVSSTFPVNILSEIKSFLSCELKEKFKNVLYNGKLKDDKTQIAREISNPCE